MIAWKRYNPIGEEEIRAAQKVMESGVLSSFIGSWCDDFDGGSEVKKLENEFSNFFGKKFAVSFNSLTSGLMASLGAIGIEPGDEVIVSPWTMSATATSILIWGGIPVFCDIEEDFFGINPSLLEGLITNKTKAIVVTNIFGHGSKLDEIKRIADKYGLKVIEDSAQAIGVRYKDKYCGTWGDVGGFSLNYHKQIHCGEGGVFVTDDESIALRMKMIRNHAEASVVGSPIEDLTNMVGFNFRMGELEAAIASQQIKKLRSLVKENQMKVDRLMQGIADLPGIRFPLVAENSDHGYYVFPLIVDQRYRDQWVAILTKLGVKGMMAGYVNVHRLPMYQSKIAFGKGYPWAISENDYSYEEGLCPKAENLKDQTFVGFLISMFDLSASEVDELSGVMRNEWKKLLK